MKIFGSLNFYSYICKEFKNIIIKMKKYKNGDRVKVIETGQFGRIMLYQEKSKNYKVLVNKVKHIYDETQLTEPVTEKMTNSFHHFMEKLYVMKTNPNIIKYGPWVVYGIYVVSMVYLLIKYKI
jgi:hypothetical protein